MKQYCKDHQIQQRVATSYKPTNGLAERMNREIKKKIKAGFVRNNNLEWVSHLQTYCDNINNQRQSTYKMKMMMTMMMMMIIIMIMIIMMMIMMLMLVMQ